MGPKNEQIRYEIRVSLLGRLILHGIRGYQRMDTATMSWDRANFNRHFGFTLEHYNIGKHWLGWVLSMLLF